MINVNLIEDSTSNVEIRDAPEITVAVSEITQSGGQSFKIGNGLKLKNNVLSVDTAEKVEEDNTRPVTSAAVYTEIGNIEALLSVL